MIIDFRYHIASLVAVFLALGIGMLIGSTMLDESVFTDRQDQIAEKLEQHLTELRQENEEVRVQLSVLESENLLQRQVNRDFLPYLVAGRLEGVKVALIETSTYPHEQDLRPLLELAGVEIQSVTTVNNSFQITGRKGEVLAHAQWVDMPDHQLVKKLAVTTAETILAGPTEFTDYMIHEDFVTVTGEYGLPVDAVIFLGGSHDREFLSVADVDLPMLEYFAARGITTFGVEESISAGSYMKEYQRKCRATVDNIETAAGQFALIMAMAGREGHFGVKETAQRLLPVFEH
ncbi:MAG: copper transporter [Eubacteriales bacterium]|jgi:hypothetical protein|nr:copper transporter [Bacillota bacterium]MBV1726461.1 copper transporter [Desulforudis sp.]MDQ7790372.1 copper transporter [Clostridia bacterium]MDZ4043316.1 copper transporter [Eubacteriales bacterium]MBU4532631.1 copper transporter [Bacillota bacterium]